MVSKNKHNNADVQEFKFGELSPSFGKGVVESYKPQNLKNPDDFKRKISEEVIRTEREFEKNSSFRISEMVREHRGIKNQEEADLEKIIETEVQRRLERLSEEAQERGFNQGVSEGEAKAYAEARAHMETFVDELARELEQLKLRSEETLNENRDQIYSVVKNLVKWVSLHEMKDDGYLPKLLEKLLLEINRKSNLIIRVNPEKFQAVPEILEKLEDKIGVLTNVRIEKNEELTHAGIILESENSIIDGSVEALFKSIDKIFEKVGVSDHDNS